MSTLLSIKELTKAVKGKCFSNNADNICFETVATDSRNVTENTLFVPLIGEFQDGHKYVPQAVEKGASVIFINKSEYKKNKKTYEDLLGREKNICFITVKNTLHALQDAAEAYVNKFPRLVKICVTGSCGKTTTKEMLVSVFKAKFGDKVIYTQGNFNSETGLPLSVFNIREKHEYGIFEMGMNRVNEIGEISKVLKARYGIITNIGTAHIGILGSQKNIAIEKRKAFNYIPKNGAAFVPAEDSFASFCLSGVKGKKVLFGKSISESESGVRFISDNGLKGISFSVDGLTVNLPLSGEHNFTNALGVIALAKECGIEKEFIKKGLESMPVLSGRMEIQDAKLKNGAKVTLVKDCYNANPDSMTKVIEFVSSVKTVGKKYFVLADMKELGESAESAHAEIGKVLLENKCDFVILVGKDMSSCVQVLKENGKLDFEYYENNDRKSFEKIADKLLHITHDNDIIVFKGSHSMQLENIIPEVIE